MNRENRRMTMLVIVILCIGLILSACVLACAGIEAYATVMAVGGCVVALSGIAVLKYFSDNPPRDGQDEAVIIEQGDEDL